MALALMFEDDAVVFLDAVTQYSKTRKSSVSTHPIDKSAVIADHVAKDNPRFSVKAVVSSADFQTDSTRPPALVSEFEVEPEFENPVQEAGIPDKSSLTDLLPGSVQQFLSAPDSDIVTDNFRGYTHDIVRSRLQDAWDNSELITILDYDYDTQVGRSISTQQIEDCILTSFEDVEDKDTGDSMRAILEFEKLRFASIKEADLDNVQKSSGVSDAASKESNKGDAEDGGESSDGTSGEDGPTRLYEDIEETVGDALKESLGGLLPF